MSGWQKNVIVSVREYLEREQHSQVKHEYVRGQVYPMVGASRTHNKLTLTLASALRSHLLGSGCEVFASDMKVRIGDIFYYSDVLVTCSKMDTDPHYSTEPVLIVEVLSPGTEGLDCLDKRLAYQSLPSIHEYVLVSQTQPEVQIYRRSDAGWDLESCAAGDVVRFASVGFETPIAEIYRGVLG
jgi:Uma2 family endonuclease